MPISFFLPYYNEEKILEKNALLMYHALEQLKEDFELVLVDDNSIDKGRIISKKLAKRDKIRYIRFDNGPSRRENLAIALKEARYDIIAFSDIDLSADIAFLPRMINEIKEGADIATGSRYLSIKTKRGILRKIYSIAYNTFLRGYFSSKIKDHQCGFKAFRKSALFPILDETGYDSKFRRGWFWDAELMIRAQKKHLKIVEFPVKWRRGCDSSFEFRREILMLPYIFEFKKRLANEIKTGGKFPTS